MKKTTIKIQLMRACLALGILGGWQQQGLAATGTPSADGQLDLNIRPRYEQLQQHGKKNATAQTVQTLLGYQTGIYRDWYAGLQFIDVSSFDNRYNSLINKKGAYSVIADPQETSINQAFLGYRGPARTSLKIGRQIIILGDARFVGNVGFRQNMQTFDAVTLHTGAIPGLQLFAGYSWRVKDILDRLVPMQTTLVNAAYRVLPGNTVSVFGYWYANTSPHPVTGQAGCFLPGGPDACNNGIVGASWHGHTALSPTFGVDYDAAYAKQLPYHGGPAAIDAHYAHLAVGLGWHAITGRVAYMLMSSNPDGTYGFQTPLATKHAYNGWAEVFLTTPPAGLKSFEYSLAAKLGKAKLMADYYHFYAARGQSSYGDEIDLSLTGKLLKHLSGGVQYADYRADHYAVDTQGAWAYLDYHFST